MKKKNEKRPPLFADLLPEPLDIGPFPYGKPGAPDFKTVAGASEPTPAGSENSPVHTSEL